MGKRLPRPVPGKLSALESRLDGIAQQAGSTRETLRGLIDEAGIYDAMPGGTDEVIRRAEKAAADNTARPPKTDIVAAEYDDAGNLVPFDVKYREYFPELDYARADLPNDIFFTPNIRIHNMNSYQHPGYYGLHNNGISGDIQTAKYTALKHKQKFTDVLSNLVDPGNPDNEPVPMAAMHDALQLSDEGSIPPHIVIGGLKGPSNKPGRITEIKPLGLSGAGWHGTVLHEMGHHGHGTHTDSLIGSRTVPRGPALYDLRAEGDFRDAPFPEQSPHYVLDQSVLSNQDDADNASAYAKQADIHYRTKSIEADQMLADIKRSYFLNTGILADTPEKAGNALSWFRAWSDKMPSGQDKLETVATPYIADFYSDPSFHGTQANKDIYKRRMTELYGIAAPLALQSLLSDEKQNDRQSNNVSY